MVALMETQTVHDWADRTAALMVGRTAEPLVTAKVESMAQLKVELLDTKKDSWSVVQMVVGTVASTVLLRVGHLVGN